MTEKSSVSLNATSRAEALERLAEAAQEVDRFLGAPVRLGPVNMAGFPLRWRFADTRVDGDAAVALLCLHDCLNDLTNTVGADDQHTPSRGPSGA